MFYFEAFLYAFVIDGVIKIGVNSTVWINELISGATMSKRRRPVQGATRHAFSKRVVGAYAKIGVKSYITYNLANSLCRPVR